MDQSLPKFPEACVKIIFRCGDYVLYYRTRKGIKDIPGGHIHFGETIFEALKRELREEIGFELETEPPLIIQIHRYKIIDITQFIPRRSQTENKKLIDKNDD